MHFPPVQKTWVNISAGNKQEKKRHIERPPPSICNHSVYAISKAAKEYGDKANNKIYLFSIAKFFTIFVLFLKYIKI